MAHITADRVRDTTTTTGTGALTVSGSAPNGYKTFSNILSTSDTFYYAIQHQAASEWEVGLGTYSSANTITRTTVYSSSNSGSAVNFSAGTKDIFITLAASRTVQKDASGNVTGLVIGTDVQAAISASGILKGAGSGSVSAATAGTDYVSPGGALGTPSSGTLTNCTGLPVSTGVSGFGTGVATALGNAVNASGGVITYSTFIPASGKALTVSNSLTLAGTDSTTMTFPPVSASVGYLNVPQVGGAAKTANYTAVLGDSGSMIVMNGASLTATIPANSSVAYAVGTVLTFVNIYAGNLSIAITTDTMTLVNTASTTGTRTLAQNGVATAVKVSSTSWIISGSGLT